MAGNQPLVTVEGELINRAELFDEKDLDAALARFDELGRPAQRLEKRQAKCTNAPGRLRSPRLERHGGDTDRRHSRDDRRRVVDSGVRHGREADNRGNVGDSPRSGSRK